LVLETDRFVDEAPTRVFVPSGASIVDNRWKERPKKRRRVQMEKKVAGDPKVFA